MCMETWVHVNTQYKHKQSCLKIEKVWRSIMLRLAFSMYGTELIKSKYETLELITIINIIVSINTLKMSKACAPYLHCMLLLLLQPGYLF